MRERERDTKHKRSQGLSLFRHITSFNQNPRPNQSSNPFVYPDFILDQLN